MRIYYRMLKKSIYYRWEIKSCSFKKTDDFINGKISNTLPKTSYQFGIVSVDITAVIPPVVSKSLKQAFKNFEKQEWLFN